MHVAAQRIRPGEHELPAAAIGEIVSTRAADHAAERDDVPARVNVRSCAAEDDVVVRREAVKGLKGAAKGAGSVGRGENSNIGAAAVHGAIMVGAATAGAVGAVARRFPNDRFLIYAK